MKGTTNKSISQKRAFFIFFRSLMTACLSLMKIALAPLAKRVLLPLRLTAKAPATDQLFKRKLLCLGLHYFFSNEEIDVIIKIVKCLVDAGFLIKCVRDTVQNENENKKEDL